MRFLRTLSTRSLIFVLTAAVAVTIGGAAIAVAAGGGTKDTPPPASLADAIHSALTAPAPAGITAKITFTNHLFPSGALLGQQGSALISGASGRLWATNDGRGRLELQSDSGGDVQIVWNKTNLSVYDGFTNTVYKATLPASSTTQTDSGTPPTVTEISDFLTKLAAHWDIVGPTGTNVAAQPAYSVSLSPKHDGGLLGSAQLAWDAAQGVPLSVAVYAQGASTPVLELTATEISYGAVASSDVDVSPPAGAKVVDLGSSTSSAGTKSRTPVTGVAAVSAAAGFQVVAPDTLVGLPRQDVRLIGGTGSKGALVVYGQGLGAIVVTEHKANSSSSGGPLAALPQISLDGASGHELATALGTVVTWQRTGISYILAGSLPAAAAETAARALR
ncbi:MAG: LolA family protein [Gaiellaceae bacterium]